MLFFGGGFCVSVLGVMAGPIGITFFAFPAFCLTVYYGVRNIKESNRNRKNILMGNYKIIKTKCSKIIDNSTNEYASYTSEFENGEKINLLCSVGDSFYMVYLEGSKKVNAHFSSMKYYPAQDLDIE